MRIKSLLLILFSLLAGCATTTGFNTKDVELALTPQQVINKPESTTGKKALWGGTILDIHNLEKETQIEILAYPLDEDYRPQTDKKPLGRFIILNDGYLEPATFAAGKQLSVLGKVDGVKSGKIGESKYTYALIKAEQLHIWSAKSETQTFFHFGIGIGL